MPKTLLSYMLSRLERLESPILRFREIEKYPSEELQSLLKNGTLVAAANAETIPLPSCLGSGKLIAVRQTSRGWYGIDEEDEFFAPVRLKDEDVRQYTVNVAQLVALLRQQNEIEGIGCPQEFGLISVGQRRVDGVGQVDVYLSLVNSEPDAFASRCRQLQRPAGVSKVVLLVPRHIALPATIRAALDSAGVVIAVLWRAAEDGSLAIDWQAVVEPGQVRDGVLSARKIVYRGRRHACDLTKKEMDFLAAHLTTDEIDIHQVMHARSGALWRQRYRRERGQRQTIGTFLSRLNMKLTSADPPLPISYSLARNRDFITREAALEAIAATDSR